MAGFSFNFDPAAFLESAAGTATEAAKAQAASQIATAKSVLAGVGGLAVGVGGLASGAGVGGLASGLGSMTAMSNILSIGGAVLNKVNLITSVAKGVLCLPSIISGLPGILGNVAGQLLGSLAGRINGIVSGMVGLVSDIIDEQINKVLGVVNKLLQFGALILATIGVIEQTILGILGLVNDAFNFAKDQENCRFAAAELLKCITGSIVNDMSNKLSLNAATNAGARSNIFNNALQKMKAPGNVIERHVGKISNSVDKAVSQVAASRLF